MYAQYMKDYAMYINGIGVGSRRYIQFPTQNITIHENRTIADGVYNTSDPFETYPLESDESQAFLQLIQARTYYLQAKYMYETAQQTFWNSNLGKTFAHFLVPYPPIPRDTLQSIVDTSNIQTVLQRYGTVQTEVLFEGYNCIRITCTLQKRIADPLPLTIGVFQLSEPEYRIVHNGVVYTRIVYVYGSLDPPNEQN